MIPPRPLPLLPYVFFLCLFGKIDAVIYSGPKGSGSGETYGRPELDFTIQQVSFTQKGYIQFLKYTSTVPTLTDYTFCIWVRSNNLTHNHPLLSYSKDEEERLIRVWVSRNGEDISLEIMGHLIFRVTAKLVENVWYHICQSWATQQGAWELYFNGKLRSSGSIPKLKGVPIKGGGDIVVGQEYTDFDKGLDDGIEGDVFGFNFVLSSTHTNPIQPAGRPSRRRLDRPRPANVRQSPPGRRLISADNDLNAREVFPLPSQAAGRFARGIFEDVMSLFDAEAHTSRASVPNRFLIKRPTFGHELTGRRISNEIPYEGPKPLGLMLVERSLDCGFKKGAPLSGKGVLVSWTKSPVRVFGGAILKKVQPFCRRIIR